MMGEKTVFTWSNLNCRRSHRGLMAEMSHVFASRLALATSGLDFGDGPITSQSPSPPPSNHSELAAKLLSVALPSAPNTTNQLIPRDNRTNVEQGALSPRARSRALLEMGPPMNAPIQSEDHGLGEQVPVSPRTVLARARALLDRDSIKGTTTTAAASDPQQADVAAHNQPTSLRLLPSPEVSPVKQPLVPNLATANLPPHPPYTGPQGQDSFKSTGRSAHGHDAPSSSPDKNSPGTDGGRKKELAAVAWMMECLQSLMVTHETYQRRVASKVNHVAGKLSSLENTVTRLKKNKARGDPKSNPASAKGSGLPPPPRPMSQKPRTCTPTAASSGRSNAGQGPLVSANIPRENVAGGGGGYAAAEKHNGLAKEQITSTKAPSSSAAAEAVKTTTATTAAAAAASPGRLKPPPKALVANARSRRPAGRCKSYAVSMPSRGPSVQKVSYKNTTGVDSTYSLSVRGREGRNGGPPPEVKIPEKIFVKAGAAAVVSVVFAIGEGGSGGVVSVGVRNCAEDGREDVLKFDVKPSQ